MHVACSPEYTYLFSGRCGKEGMDEMGVLPHFSGVAVHDCWAAFDNNQAERDLRMIKTKTKVSGCFRTEEGIRNYLTVMSYAGTAKKHGKNAYEAIKSIFENNCGFVFE